jgi:hypothetical protein
MLTTLAIAVIVLLALQAVLVAIASAVRPKANIYVTIVLASVVTAPLALLYGTRLAGQPLGVPLGPDGRLYFVLIHLALGGFLFHFMTLPDRSVTLRILVEVLLAPGQALSTQALSSRYGVKTMITSRLEQLSAGGFIEISSDRRIALTGKGRSFGRFVTAGRKLFGIDSAN